MKTEESIFAAAIDLPVSQRASFVSEACKNDEALRHRIFKLLDGHDATAGILDVQFPLSASPIENLIGSEIGHYRLVEKLGEGGFGIVFKADQQQPIKRSVALKIIKPGMDSSAVIARFEAERQALAMMNHPNIASVLDGGTTADHRPYFVMELVEGIPITEFCDANSYSIQQRLKLFISVCHAVHHAHQKGIIHRDIKPNNVMVALHDQKPIVKVIDFGISKALNEQLTDKTLNTLSGFMAGTPQYMSPEQADTSGLDVDTRTDVYSLAMLLYETLTGTTAIDPEVIRTATYHEVQNLVCDVDAVRPSLKLAGSRELSTLASQRNSDATRVIKQIQGELDWITLKGLEKDRNRRYESARELALDVERILANQPVHARPPSFVYRIRKYAIRNRIGLAFTVTVFAIIVAVTAGLVNNQFHLLTAKKKEQAQFNTAIDEANTALTAAVKDLSSNELWTAARLKVDEIKKLSGASLEKNSTTSRTREFIDRYHQVRDDRDFSLSMEELLINKSTDQSLASLLALKRGFEEIMNRRGYALDKLSPEELGDRLPDDRTPIKLTDAVELWLATRIKISSIGGQEISDLEVERWVESMCTADPNPMRTVIRKTVFQTGSTDEFQLNQVVTDRDLAVACARKLSWLSEAYLLVGAPNRAREIREFALAQHSNDLMLNFEHASRLLDEGKPDQSVRYFMRCTAIRPGIPGVWRGLAVALWRNNELGPAKKALGKALELDPNHAKSRQLLVKWDAEERGSR